MGLKQKKKMKRAQSWIGREGWVWEELGGYDQNTLYKILQELVKKERKQSYPTVLPYCTLSSCSVCSVVFLVHSHFF